MRALLSVLIVLLVAPLAHAATAKKPWPPREGQGDFFVHYGEEHWNDIDGEVVLSQVVDDVSRYKPDLVTMSGDKDNDGTTEQLEKWRSIMEAYDRAGVPYMAGVGNHDGKQQTPEPVTDAAAGATPIRDIQFYLQVFAGRPYPFGDAPPYANPKMGPSARPPDDPQGASTHYYVDFGNTRFVFLDSSCYGIINCDPYQNPPDGKGRDQFTYLGDLTREAKAKGMVVFVVTHMPTRDPRDQDQATTTSRNHVMGKGISPDNERLEREAAALGISGVLLGHIKGLFQYRGQGDIPYYIDGGAGGELYSEAALGVDHGYWYGWRILHVDGTKVTTDVVPVIKAGGIRVEGPPRLQIGDQPLIWSAYATQPATQSHRGVVKNLELRDPDPVPKSSSSGLIPWTVLLWVSPLLALWLAAVVRLPRRRRLLATAVPVALVSLAAAAGAQRSVPTATPVSALPNPARIFTSGDPTVLAPVASDSDDARRDRKTQTADGRFEPVCPGRTEVTVTSGFEESSIPVQVKSSPGSIASHLRRKRVVRRSSKRRLLAKLKLRQYAAVEASLFRRGKRVGRLRRTCRSPGTRHLKLKVPKRGRYTLKVTLRSDRKPIVRRLRIRVR